LAAIKVRGAKYEPQLALDLAMSQGELALLVGASRPKVNIALTLLEDSGAIKRTGTKVVCDLEALELLAATGV
jgi:CRP/FNR family transcriptional regulator, cyclic AMP receptor protein